MNVNERMIGPELGDDLIRPDGERLQIKELYLRDGQEFFAAWRMRTEGTLAERLPVAFSGPLLLSWDESEHAWRLA